MKLSDEKRPHLGRWVTRTVLPAEVFGKGANTKYLEEMPQELFRIKTTCLEPRKKNYRVGVESTPELNKNIDITVKTLTGDKKIHLEKLIW